MSLDADRRDAGAAETAAPVDGQTAAVAVTELSKSYGATRALRGVAFDVKAGQVQALLGGNGSGKSTAIKVLAGVVPADAGSVRINGTTMDARALDGARVRSLGLRFVHQQPAVFNELTVAENIALGFEFPRGRFGQIRWGEVRRRGRAVLERLQLDIDPDRSAAALGPAGQAMVAIARALQDLEALDQAVLVLDEPTAALPPVEVSILLDAMKRYAAEGLGLLFVTHRLEEVLEVADAATILKDGEVAAVLDKSEMTHDSLVEGIVGSTIDQSRWKPIRGHEQQRDERPRLSVRGLSGGPIKDIGFEVAEGEVVGIAGLLGSGRSSLLRMLFGAVPMASGEVLLDGHAVDLRDSRRAIDHGIAYVPEDRARDALFKQLSVTENASVVVTNDYWRHGLLRRRRERADAVKLMDRFSIRAAGESAPGGSLSGGNQQKVVLARWLRRPLQLLLLDEPTQGVDVGARAEIFEAVGQAVKTGTSVVMASSEFEELTLVCDRILVMHRGEIVSEVPDASIDVLELERIVNQGTHNGG